MLLETGEPGIKSPSKKRIQFQWRSALKPIVFVLALLPFLLLLQSLLTGQLGPNPIDTLTDQTGTYAIRMLLISLTLTPLRWLLKETWPIRFRRMIGLFAFFYAALHVTTYLLLDQQFDMAAVWSDLSERPYIVAGTVAFLILLPLAVTSNRRMVKRLGTRWLGLHRWVYIAGTAAVVHYVWLAKGDLIEPLVYLLILLLLFSYRLIKMLR